MTSLHSTLTRPDFQRSAGAEDAREEGVARLRAGVEVAARHLGGGDSSLRLLAILLEVEAGGEAGVDGVTIARNVESSQASTSRNLKILALEHQLVEFFLDTQDFRRRLVRLTPKGRKVVGHLARTVT